MLSINQRSMPAPEESNGPTVKVSRPAGMSVTGPAIMAGAALLLGVGLSYAQYQSRRHEAVQAQAFHDQLESVNRSLDVIGQRLDESGDQAVLLQSRLSVTMERVGMTQRDLANARALAQRLKQDLEQKASTAQVASLQSEAGQNFNTVNREITDVKGKVEDNRQELAKTLEQLTAVGVRVTEQGTMIATNSTGLAELRLRGERDFVTIDLRKKQRVPAAGIALELRKADPKKHRADLRIHANDVELDRKDIYVNTPIYFYVDAGPDRIQYELVINKVSKDRITGYISAPKGTVTQNLGGVSRSGRD